MRTVLLPRTLSELWSRMEEEPDAALYAGGTDLLVKLRRGGANAPSLICLERIEELRAIRKESEDIWIGAAATHRQLLSSSLIREELPILSMAIKTLGSPLIRGMGTIGGNICTASPAGDCLPPLYVLDAVAELRSRSTVRSMPVAAFIPGPGETRLKKGEILAGVRVKKPEGFAVHHFEKVGQRKAMAIAVASLAAMLKISGSGIVEEARLAWGSVGPTVVRSAEVEAAFIGEKLSDTLLEKAASLARQIVSPIDDLRASADYRRTVAGNLLFRLGTGIGRWT
jgi:CO/xanthine dehydrogenase FAD-binding subunit